MFNIFSLNVGMNNSLAGLTALVSSENLDIICLQEVRLTGSQIESLLPGFNAVANVDLQNLSVPGTAIIWRNNIPVENIVSLKPCRMQIASLGPYRLLNIYAPSGSNLKHERDLFFSQDVFQALQLFPELPYLLCGDYNCVLKPIDVENGIGFSQKKVSSLTELG